MESQAVFQADFFTIELDPRFELYGVKPSGGALAAATACLCSGAPTAKTRKAVYMRAAWHDGLKDPRSGEKI